MATYEPDDKRDLEKLNRQLETAKKQTSDRSDKVDDLTSRFRELRRRNHFRLMLEEIFHD